MTSLTRRQLLTAVGAAGTLPLLSACDSSPTGLEQRNATTASFQHGVASGDPLADRVILWTRVSPLQSDYTGSLAVAWEIAADEGFSEVLQHGVVQTGPERDFTVKLDATGLSPASTYYYRFRVGDAVSAIGRTRTAPTAGAEKLRFAVASCSNYGFGYFHAYRRIAEQADIDAVLHLGDYIYEYGAGEFEGDGLCFFRGCTPDKEIISLEDYRLRHAEYKTDPDLQEAHRVHPWVVTWDDHEFTNNAWRDGAQNHSPEEGDYAQRKAIAARVFDEWMPIRLPDPGRPEKIFRRIAYGELVDLIMLDTRSYGRDEQVATAVPLIGAGATDIEALDDPGRTILGAEQLAWLNQQLSSSRAQWKLLGQQVIFAPLQLLGQPSAVASGTVFNADAWDGYRASRQRVLDIIEHNQIDNVVVLTGDVHSSWALDIARDPYDPTRYNPATGEGALAIEFVTPGITMPAIPGQEASPATNPHLRYVNTSFNGYMVVEISSRQITTQWWHVSEVRSAQGTQVLGRSLTAQSGNNYIDRLPT